METAVIYSRVSTEDQEYKRQTQELKDYADYKKYKLEKTFEEKVSGYIKDIERVKYEQMKEYVVKNKINHILIWEISRLSRRTHIALKEIEYFNEQKVNIYFLKENISSISNNSLNQVLIALLSSISQMEKETITARFKSGMIRKASEGQAHGFGVLPYGFTKDENKKLIIDEKEAKWIRQMYTWKKEGKGIKGIATELNKKGVETRRTKIGQKRKLHNGDEIDILWRSNTIGKILKSPLYKGERHYSGKIIQVPKIVDDELWDAVQNTFSENIGYKNRTVYKYLFKGKIYCGKCGLAYLSRSEVKGGSTWSSFYFCSGRKDKAIKCNNGQYKASTFDKQVWILLASMAEFREELHKDRVSKVDVEESKREIAYLQKQLKSVEGKRKRIVMTFQDGEIDEKEYRDTIRKIKSDQIEWNNEISEIKNRIKRRNKAITDLKRAKIQNIRWFMDRRKYIEKWVDKVVLTSYEEGLEGTHGNDKVMKVDLYAFGLKEPRSALISSVSDIVKIL